MEESRQMFKAICSECENECEVPFEPTEGKPVYCSDCFRKRKPNNRNGNRSGGFGRRNSFDRGPREMHKAKCADCGSECEVPFKPTAGKPVYCKECYMSRKDN